MRFTDDDIRRIKDRTDNKLVEVVGKFHDLRKSGTSFVCDCPVCGGRDKLNINPAKGIFKCFNCATTKGKTPINYLMVCENKSYTEALEFLATEYGIILDAPPAKKPRKKLPAMKQGSKAAAGHDVTTFCARMLAESGLTYQDVTARGLMKTDEKSSVFEAATFRPGTIDEKGNIVDGDDVIIEYYDLDGNPVTYTRKLGRGTSEARTYYRVRWQYPDEHLDKDGKPFKYKSPAQSGTPIYIPQRLRHMYRTQEPIPRLYIQEGEKKAEKACKHGIPSIAVSGIQNLGQNGKLPEDLVRIIQTCGVKEVAFIFDSDWQDLSHTIKINTPVNKRPYAFFSAAKNFKDYMRMLKNRGVMVEIYIGHINKNDEGDKGLDDLLADKLAGHEDELAKDIEFACNEKSGVGQYVEMFKITTWNDQKLKELWNLQSHEKFAEQHKDVLAGLPEFLFGRYAWKFDESGKLVSASPFDEDEKFWSEVRKENRDGTYKTDADGNPVYEVTYDYVAGKNFFQNRGIGRYRLADGQNWIFVHLDPPVVRTISVDDARDFMYSFAEAHCSRRVNNMLLQGGSQYVGPYQMSRLAFIQPNFINMQREEQYFYFSDTCWHINQQKVEEVGYEGITHHIWREQKRDFSAKYLGKPLISFRKEGDECTYTLTEEGRRCHYLQFLINTSNFTWRKKPEEIEKGELYENNLHLLSKLCAIGYMLMEVKDPNVARAVVGMDGKQSEVGESNGRSGKSLIGELIRQVMPLAYLPGKRPDLLNDAFVWNDIEESTRLVFIDDVLQNFNFEALFPNITGDWTVNKKGGVRITFPFTKSPKIYLATNHAIRGSGSSFADRQWLIAFSDYYNESHKPVDDFGVLFFSEWDYTQWNLCWNLLACCVQLYLKYGVVQAPGERLQQRKLRQEIGEVIISWADEYYSSEDHLGKRLPRKEVYDNFINYDPAQRKYITPTSFKDRIKKYCEWSDRGLVFNPHKYDPISGKPLFYDKDGKPVIDDKSGGVEYFTIGLAIGTKAEPPSDPMGLPTENDKLDF